MCDEMVNTLEKKGSLNELSLFPKKAKNSSSKTPHLPS